MIQIIFMIIGLVYFVKLLTMRRLSATKLGLDPTTFEEWRRAERRKYYWMIAAGWGSFLVTVVLGFAASIVLAIVFPQGSEKTTETAVTCGVGLVGIIVILVCYIRSAKFAKQAKSLASQDSSEVASIS